MAEITDLSKVREKREVDRILSREPDVSIHGWYTGDSIDTVQLEVTNAQATPVSTNRARAQHAFDMLWQSASEEAQDRVLYIAYCDSDGHRWMRLAESAVEPDMTMAHVWWHLRAAWAVGKPFLRAARGVMSNRLRSAWGRWVRASG